jgi:hypothetical protein
MTRKLKLVKGGSQRGTLVYGMRWFEEGTVSAVDEAHVSTIDGSPRQVTMHLIEGTRAQIRRQLMNSIDAFFELLDEPKS